MPIFKKERGQVLRSEPIGIHWDAEDPFFFISHHYDDYPKGNSQQAPPQREVSGRMNLGRNYDKEFGYRMYNGKVVPGFPLHSHWGYETVTVVEKGYIDHFDSMGNQGRYGFGDVQWLSAGSRYEHCEMYPLAFDDRKNPTDITQIMIDLPLEHKNSPNEVRMLWSEQIPVLTMDDGNGHICTVKVIAGRFGDTQASLPNRVSWAADPEHHVRILKLVMSPDAELTIPAVSTTVNRNLYFVSGGCVSIDGQTYEDDSRLKLVGNEDVNIKNGNETGEYWLLEGEPIGEKMIVFGPVSLPTDKDVRNAMDLIRKKELDDWQWGLVDRAQPKGTDRFIRYTDGHDEYPMDDQKKQA
jgi:quercetin 2,3-dioxygenase